MFAPGPTRADGWAVVVGRGPQGEFGLSRLALDGTWSTDPSFDKPELLSATFPSSRWQKYLSHLGDPRPGLQAGLYARWLVGRWNQERPDTPVEDVEVWFVSERSIAIGTPQPRPIRAGSFRFVDSGAVLAVGDP